MLSNNEWFEIPSKPDGSSSIVLSPPSHQTPYLLLHHRRRRRRYETVIHNTDILPCLDARKTGRGIRFTADGAGAERGRSGIGDPVSRAKPGESEGSARGGVVERGAEGAAEELGAAETGRVHDDSGEAIGGEAASAEALLRSVQCGDEAGLRGSG